MNNPDSFDSKEGQTHSSLRLAAIDIETMGTGPNAFVFQIGVACAEIAPDGLILERRDYYWQLDETQNVFDADDIVFATGLMDFGAINFHVAHRMRTFVENEKLIVFNDPNVLMGHIQNSEWSMGYWIAQNHEFDTTIIKNKTDNQCQFYDFRKTIDIRTLQNLGLLPQKLPGKTHNALEDARVELDAVIGLIVSKEITLC